MKFFETLPRTLKLVLHFVTLSLCLYAGTLLLLLLTPYGPVVLPYLSLVGIGFLLIFPPVYTLLEVFFGEPTDKPDFTDRVADKLKDALTGTLDRDARPRHQH